MLEMAVSVQLKEYLSIQDFITNDPSACLKKKHSTETAVHKVILILLDNVHVTEGC